MCRTALALLTLLTILNILHAADAKQAVAAARQAVEEGNLAEALKLVDEAIQADPKLAPAFAVKSDILETQKKFPEALTAINRAIELDPDMAAALDRRGNIHFKMGEFKQSLADYDAFLEKQPRARAAHWRRGITLYYLGEYQAGADQFELGKVVFGNDVENSFWHFLCLSRVIGIEKAREKQLKIGLDKRVPFTEIEQMIRGKLEPKAVIAAAEKVGPLDEPKAERYFYAHLYAGLYEEALGDAKQCEAYLKEAVEKYPIGHYMADVARVHLKARAKK